MRACIQRVRQAAVTVAGQTVGAIDQGLVVLLGVGHGDTETEAKLLAEKTVALRIFDDDDGKMNRSLADVGGGLLVVSQFTLLGDCRKGRRPSFTDAAPPELAESLYQTFVTLCRTHGVRVETGVFRAQMQVSLVNDGPVTLIIDARDGSLR